MDMHDKAKWRLSLGYKYFTDEPRNVPTAVREFQRVTELAPDWSKGYALLSCALEEINQIDHAISVSRAGLRVAPEDAQHLISLGRMYLLRHEYSKASKMFGPCMTRPWSLSHSPAMGLQKQPPICYFVCFQKPNH
jgi:Tfp pilus assembly protein PilF